MQRESFIELLGRNSPTEILDYIKRKGKKPKPINPLIFYDDNGNVAKSN